MHVLFLEWREEEPVVECHVEQVMTVRMLSIPSSWADGGFMIAACYILYIESVILPLVIGSPTTYLLAIFKCTHFPTRR